MGLTTNPNDPELERGVDSTPVEQHKKYIVLSDEELAKGFVRPVRKTYVHAKELGGCGGVTRMGDKLAETYAANPGFYGATYCYGCRMHRPVGEQGEFFWIDDAGNFLAERVGT